MCGIVGYTGNENAAPILIEGLSRLEYRGYDSAGIAVSHSGAKAAAKRAVSVKSKLLRLKAVCRHFGK